MVVVRVREGQRGRQRLDTGEVPQQWAHVIISQSKLTGVKDQEWTQSYNVTRVTLLIMVQEQGRCLT